MNPTDTERYHSLYEQHLTNLKLQGKRPATIDAYSRPVRRITQFFGCCPDTLSKQQLKRYFATLIETHSWSTVKLNRNGLQFFYRYTLNKKWEWLDIVRPPHVSKVPDVITPQQVALLINRCFEHYMGASMSTFIELLRTNKDELEHYLHQQKISAQVSNDIRSAIQAASSVLKSFAERQNKGALGFTAVLHTHNRQRDLHPHLHIIVAGGRYDSPKQVWHKDNKQYLFNAFALAKVWRARLLSAINKHPQLWRPRVKRLGAVLAANTKWCVWE
ncbi:phage integrase N-terminal SAM-like domain-containing protein [Vibrio agarivorans]|uniref:phage integrase N-terminal SAM-like domain-containing protein n=1 Tax=Vibrio agarivorans TaxID=153622 RepID=UPI00222F4446|nr:phage integrase N-terminal SAM-like domain-containing protein [Vibrio agarivorans]MDN3660312.1 phage integrase N-terminal SAM-like domain-containing protein [Vibrio agarivorans]